MPLTTLVFVLNEQVKLAENANPASVNRHALIYSYQTPFDPTSKEAAVAKALR